MVKTIEGQWLSTPDQIPLIAKYTSNQLVIGTTNGDLLLYDYGENYIMRATISPHSLSISSISVPDDCQVIVTASTDGLVVVSDVATHAVLKEFDCEELIFPKAAISHDGKQIAMVGHDGRLRVESDETQLFNDRVCSETLIGVCFCVEQIVTVSRHCLVVCNPQSDQPPRKVTTEDKIKHRIFCVSAHPSEPVVAVGCWGGAVCLFDIRGEIECVCEIFTQARLVQSVEFSRDGQFIVAACSNSNVVLIDVNTRGIIVNSSFSQKNRLLSAAIAQDNSSIVFVTDNKTSRSILLKEDEPEPQPEE